MRDPGGNPPLPPLHVESQSRRPGYFQPGMRISKLADSPTCREESPKNPVGSVTERVRKVDSSRFSGLN